MKKAAFEDLLARAAQQVDAGAFLLAGNDPINPMTIGWCQWGILWGKPVCTVFVRKSRHTYDKMRSGVFTVSVPEPGAMKKELAYCGTKSGRDVNKAEALGFQFLPMGGGLVPALSGCALHFACRTLFHVDFDAERMREDMDAGIRARFYGANQKLGNGDPHVAFFGEIVAAYEE